MSDNWLRILPTDPAFVPDARTQRLVVQVVREIAPGADAIAVRHSEHPELLDAGVDLGTIRCPSCHGGLPGRWWSASVDAAWSTRFVDLSVVTPCCAAATSLNDLVYDWPQGFARWWIEVLGPGRGWLDERELEAVRTVLGREVRVVLTHR